MQKWWTLLIPFHFFFSSMQNAEDLLAIAMPPFFTYFYILKMQTYFFLCISFFFFFCQCKMPKICSRSQCNPFTPSLIHHETCINRLSKISFTFFLARFSLHFQCFFHARLWLFTEKESRQMVQSALCFVSSVFYDYFSFNFIFWRFCVNILYLNGFPVRWLEHINLCFWRVSCFCFSSKFFFTE